MHLNNLNAPVLNVLTLLLAAVGMYQGSNCWAGRSCSGLLPFSVLGLDISWTPLRLIGHTCTQFLLARSRLPESNVCEGR